ncbi:MAG: MoxR family ATPase [bacterium]|nr:MoxR family ATPase [bacterium]
MLKENTVEFIAQEVKKAIKGKDDVIESVLTAILAKGHILIEDIPGVGKTTLALAFSKVMDLDYKRMQFTPDVLPTDVVGFSVLTKQNTFEYKPGAVLCNLFLADEINRTSSKTQSALLEVMEEGSVTVDGVTREVPNPFVVIATQNPVGSVGTQMLPESQLDRFMVRLSMGYPDINQEISILKGKQDGDPLKLVDQIVTTQDIITMQEEVTKIFVHDVLYAYIAALVAATRNHPMITLGVSPRGSIALTKMAKARAYVKNRDYVIPEDITSVFLSVVGHRLVLNPKAKVNHVSVEDVVGQILSQVSSPKL